VIKKEAEGGEVIRREAEGGGVRSEEEVISGGG
jgi:hypothetical protein